jgi:hypothetical protein
MNLIQFPTYRVSKISSDLIRLIMLREEYSYLASRYAVFHSLLLLFHHTWVQVFSSKVNRRGYTYRHTQRQQGDVIGVLLLFQNRERGLKAHTCLIALVSNSSIHHHIERDSRNLSNIHYTAYACYLSAIS